MIFSQLNYVRLKINYLAVTDLFLTDNKGSTLSGLFKTALKRSCCDVQGVHCKPSKRSKNSINERFCPNAKSCLYAFTAEHISEIGEDTVLPYVIACSSVKKRYIPRGSLLEFELVLMGHTVEYIDEIIAGLMHWQFYEISHFRSFYTSDEIEAFGLPNRWPQEIRSRGLLRLEKVEQILGDTTTPIYQGNSIVQPPFIESLEIRPSQENYIIPKIKINFISPAQFKKKRRIVRSDDFSFDIFYHALSRRLTSLIKYFGSFEDDQSEEKSELQYCHDLASEVRTTINSLKMEKIIRGYDLKECYDVFKGEVIFENVHSCFKPWIKAGEIIHVGKFPTLGLGEFNADFL